MCTFVKLLTITIKYATLATVLEASWKEADREAALVEDGMQSGDDSEVGGPPPQNRPSHPPPPKLLAAKIYNCPASYCEQQDEGYHSHAILGIIA